MKNTLFALFFALLLVSCAINYQNTNSQNQAPASDVILPTGYVGTRYSALLTIQGITRENVGTVVEAKKLPAGISLELIELPCAPQATQCLPQPYLIGTPTSSGNYQFVITTSSMKVGYGLLIK